MNVKKILGLALTTLALNMVILADANAAGVTVKCEVSSSRSKASVAGIHLSGRYVAKLSSGGKTVQSKPLAADRLTHEVEFDFDSNPKDIAAGAAAIPANFIKNAKVVGGVYVASTGALIGQVGASCKVK